MLASAHAQKLRRDDAAAAATARRRARQEDENEGEPPAKRAHHEASAAAASAPVDKMMLIPPAELREGTMLAHGGCADVYLADWSKGGVKVAMKKFKLAPHATPKQRQQVLSDLQREFKHMFRLKKHPSILQVHGAYIDERTPLIVTEYLPFGSLYDCLYGKNAEHRPPPEQFLSMALQMAEAVEHMHAHMILHRDIKPENILVGEDFCCKLADFESAMDMESEDSNENARVTEDYIAPESFSFHGGKPSHPNTPAADLYSLGVTIAELWTGQRPLRQGHGRWHALRDPDNRLTQQRERILRALLSKPEDRGTAAQLVRNLHALKTAEHDAAQALVSSHRF
jgi:serine/threonine-protein kinase